MKINFIVTGEGVSDLRLTEHIENILIGEGFSEVSGEAPDLSMFKPPPGRSTLEKIASLIAHYPNTDLIFVHRDADNSGITARKSEILAASEKIGISKKVIPIIPLQALETWLLADFELIKEVAGKKDAKRPSILPAIGRLEGLSDPKKTLMDVLCEVSCAQGSKLRKFRSRFGEMRARLTFSLNPEGPVKRLDSYSLFREELHLASKKILSSK